MQDREQEDVPRLCSLPMMPFGNECAINAYNWKTITDIPSSMRTLLLLAAAAAIVPGETMAQPGFSKNPSSAPDLKIPVQSGATFRSGDTFELRLSGMPKEDARPFAQPFTIGADGFLSIPLVGQIHAAGLTQSQLERAIERKLIEEEIFRFPTATIYAGARVTVGGRVRSPIRLPWPPVLRSDPTRWDSPRTR